MNWELLAFVSLYNVYSVWKMIKNRNVFIKYLATFNGIDFQLNQILSINSEKPK